MTAVTITVTQDDIAKGAPGSACDCPVWHAIKRALLPGVTAVIGPSDCALSDSSMTDYAAIPLPAAAARFVEDFDHELPVRPFAFTLDVPDDLTGGGA